MYKNISQSIHNNFSYKVNGSQIETFVKYTLSASVLYLLILVLGSMFMTQRAQASDVKFMSYNLDVNSSTGQWDDDPHDTSPTLPNQIAVIDEYNPDILGLHEFNEGSATAHWILEELVGTGDDDYTLYYGDIAAATSHNSSTPYITDLMDRTDSPILVRNGSGITVIDWNYFKFSEGCNKADGMWLYGKDADNAEFVYYNFHLCGTGGGDPVPQEKSMCEIVDMKNDHYDTANSAVGYIDSTRDLQGVLQITSGDWNARNHDNSDDDDSDVIPYILEYNTSGGESYEPEDDDNGNVAYANNLCVEASSSFDDTWAFVNDDPDPDTEAYGDESGARPDIVDWMLVGTNDGAKLTEAVVLNDTAATDAPWYTSSINPSDASDHYPVAATISIECSDDTFLCAFDDAVSTGNGQNWYKLASELTDNDHSFYEVVEVVSGSAVNGTANWLPIPDKFRFVPDTGSDDSYGYFQYKIKNGSGDESTATVAVCIGAC